MGAATEIGEVPGEDCKSTINGKEQEEVGIGAEKIEKQTDEVVITKKDEDGLPEIVFDQKEEEMEVFPNCDKVEDEVMTIGEELSNDPISSGQLEQSNVAQVLSQEEKEEPEERNEDNLSPAEISIGNINTDIPTTEDKLIEQNNTQPEEQNNSLQDDNENI